MNITKEKVDNLNIILKIEIKKDDYIENVNKALANYRKRASVPGFRKGFVPIDFLKKQYGKSLISDEVNKLIQAEMSKFIQEESIRHLGQPIPKQQEGFDWEEKDFFFEFELGLKPSFKPNFKLKNVTYYKIAIKDEDVERQIQNLRKRFGNYNPEEAIKTEDDLISANITGDNGIDAKDKTFSINELNEKQAKKFKPLKKGDSINVSLSKFFKEKNKIASLLEINEEELRNIKELKIEILSFKNLVLAEVNQEFYDKVLGKDKVTSDEEFRVFIKKILSKNCQQNTDVKFQNDFTEAIIENTSFKLPKNFLIKWMSISGETPLTEEEAQKQFENSEQAIRYQLIETAIIETFDVKIDNEGFKLFIENDVKAKMESYGQTEFEPSILKNIVDSILSNSEQIKSYSDLFIGLKINELFKKEGTYKTKEVSHEKYLEITEKELEKKAKKSQKNELRKRI